MFCHVYGRGKGQAQMIPGWPYSVVAALEPGRTSWTAVLDAVRLGPGGHQTQVTAAQVRGVVTRLIEAGHWRDGDPEILMVFDAGYDIARLAWLLAGPAGAGAGPGAFTPGAVRARAAAGQQAPRAVPPGMAPSRSSPTRPPGLTRGITYPGTPTTRYGTAVAPAPGTGCTPGSPAAPAGRSTTASCRSSKER